MSSQEQGIYIVLIGGSYGQRMENGRVELREKGDIVKVDKAEALRLIKNGSARLATVEDVH